MRSTYLGVIVAAILAVSACGGGTSRSSTPATAPPNASPSPAAPGPTGSAPSGEAVQLTIGTDTGTELKFDPAEPTVQAGADVRVTFENRASVPHNLTFQAPINIASETAVAPGTSDTVEFTAPAPGEYALRLHLAPGYGREAHRHRRSVMTELRSPRPELPDEAVGLDPDDEGLGNVGPDEVVELEPDDEGLGNVGPDEVVELEPDDEGLGNIGRDEVVELEPDDEGLGNIGPDVVRVDSAG